MHAPPQGNPARVVIDHDRHVIEVDGQAVPYYVREGGPVTEPWSDGKTLVTFECFVVAQDVQTVGTPRKSDAAG
ncbi:hypothetical protein [Mycobacteroides abscessus]|uniref:hypothetical protein n=1 Tax=Mycobacteroides abscessus TaxID=36809 RepID=UPI00092B0FD7|nr:hypothetical protein [Mycobacteroides abscessus]MBE5440201.1 hypothetical protein [Mycobacteroides abscessus]SID45695.1 Uncharacterised protein [Mycobacteroides abscessus subsp. abscessus]SIG28228.1 Uncharacterised protein [Mycobacteroides abscessus subsp. abscessus]SIK21523.1 Uncharacterised protein [Mycobacteroides abscessus subsp. abscessus]SKU08371.1 Uncharacterised protein [Mycobacteroides abscessus subsp. abscessus]